MGEPIRFFAALVFVWLVPSAASAADSVMCSESLQLQGDQEAVADLRGKLAPGTLGALAADVCGRAVVEIRSVGATYEVKLTLGDERVERTVDTIVDASVWVESWLLPLASSDDVIKEREPAKIEPNAAGRDASEAVNESGPVLRPEPEVIVVHPGALLSVMGAALVSDDGAVWAGGELSADILLSPTLWLGAGLGGAFDTEASGPLEGQVDMRRGFIHATARAGLRIALSQVTDLRLGGGVGVGSAWAAQVFENGDDADKGRGGLMVESLARVVTPLGEDVSLSTGFVLRSHVVRFGTGGLDPDETSLPEPMPVWHAELQVGVGFSVGGGP